MLSTRRQRQDDEEAEDKTRWQSRLWEKFRHVTRGRSKSATFGNSDALVLLIRSVSDLHLPIFLHRIEDRIRPVHSAPHATMPTTMSSSWLSMCFLQQSEYKT